VVSLDLASQKAAKGVSGVRCHLGTFVRGVSFRLCSVCWQRAESIFAGAQRTTTGAPTGWTAYDAAISWGHSMPCHGTLARACGSGTRAFISLGPLSWPWHDLPAHHIYSCSHPQTTHSLQGTTQPNHAMQGQFTFTAEVSNRERLRATHSRSSGGIGAPCSPHAWAKLPLNFFPVPWVVHR
jgi:hypothetical protein